MSLDAEWACSNLSPFFNDTESYEYEVVMGEVLIIDLSEFVPNITHHVCGTISYIAYLEGMVEIEDSFGEFDANRMELELYPTSFSLVGRHTVWIKGTQGTNGKGY